MRTSELAVFEKEILEFARGIEKSTKSFYKIFLVASKVILSLVKEPVLKKQISPGKFEDVVQTRSWSGKSFDGPFE